MGSDAWSGRDPWSIRSRANVTGKSRRLKTWHLPKAAYGRNQMAVLEGRAAVASAMARETATTERGPPDHLKTCAQNAHKLRRKGLKLPSAATNWIDALRSPPSVLGRRPRRSVALQISRQLARKVHTSYTTLSKLILRTVRNAPFVGGKTYHFTPGEA